VRLAAGATGRVIVPSGASTGSHEARELRDGGLRDGGQGVSRAIAGVNEILSPVVQGLDAADQAAVDSALEAADGTPALQRLGANAVLAVSLAAPLANANHTALPLYRVMGGDAEPLLPLPTVNIISGGAHAGAASEALQQDPTELWFSHGPRSSSSGVEPHRPGNRDETGVGTLGRGHVSQCDRLGRRVRRDA
jgi:enolase